LLDRRDGTAMCACRACTLLFERDAAGGDHYLLIPRGRTRLSGVPTAPLNVPVGLAFFVVDDGGRVLARYPSPLGTVETTISGDTWRAVCASAPTLAAMRPWVEAFLVRTNARTGAEDQWLVPIDDCFRLVALIRRHWTGMSGGSAIWREVARFFDELDQTDRRTGEEE
jgi:hypothetical protein